MLPQPGEATTGDLLFVGMMFFIFIPILGWIASLIAMKFYHLDQHAMKDIQKALEERNLSLEN